MWIMPFIIMSFIPLNLDYVLEPDRYWEFIIIGEYCCQTERKILSACILSSSTWSLQVLYSEVRSLLSSPQYCI